MRLRIVDRCVTDLVSYVLVLVVLPFEIKTFGIL